MKPRLILLLVLVCCQPVRAQQMEPIPSSEQSRFLQMPQQERMAWLQNNGPQPGGTRTRQEAVGARLVILPDTIHAGEAFDAYYMGASNYESAIFGLYAVQGKRKKKIVQQEFPILKNASFAFMLWIAIDTPGTYELTACQPANPAFMADPEEATSHRTIVVYEHR